MVHQLPDDFFTHVRHIAFSLALELLHKLGENTA
jgi:hypothetical protein